MVQVCTFAEHVLQKDQSERAEGACDTGAHVMDHEILAGSRRKWGSQEVAGRLRTQGSYSDDRVSQAGLGSSPEVGRPDRWGRLMGTPWGYVHRQQKLPYSLHSRPGFSKEPNINWFIFRFNGWNLVELEYIIFTGLTIGSFLEEKIPS